MPNIVKHLRADEATWAEYDAVIEDGEIALMKTESGRYRMKIGNGELSFSELEMFGGEVFNAHEGDIYLNHCGDYRIGEAEEITIYFPYVMDNDYYSLLTFDSGSYPTDFYNGDDTPIMYSGSSITDGEFVPLPDMHYTLVFWFDGRIQCHVRGVSNA